MGTLVITPDVEARFWAKVQRSETGCWEWTSGHWGDGYGIFLIQKRAKAAHRVAYTLLHGPIPEGVLLDHRCHNKGCVNPSHLRFSDHKSNAENRTGANRNNKSGVRGVWWEPKRGKWLGRVMHEGRSYFIGSHEHLEDAKTAIEALRNELFTHNDMDRRVAA